MTQNIFGGEVARLEEALAAALRGTDNAERNANRLADLLAEEKRNATAIARAYEEKSDENTELRRQLDAAKVFSAKVADAERKASDQSKRAVKAEREGHILSGKWAKALAERDEARDLLAAAVAENDRLAAEIGPVRALAAAIQQRHEAELAMTREAKKIRAEA